MSPPNPKSPALQSLGELAPLAAADAMSCLHSVSAQVLALHQAGRLHGAIVSGGVLFDENQQPTLSPPAEHVVLDAETCPPEMPAGRFWDLPTDLTLARQALTASGVEMDPRRIDVFQLGGLLCRLLTGQSTSDYLRSPSSRGLIPPALRPVVDRALGHDAETRTADCQQFSALLAEAESGAAQNWQQETPALGSARTPVTLPGPLAQQPEELSHRAESAGALLTRLGAFKILGRIGGGGMGDVYKAHDDALDRIVAIKVLPPELARHADFVRRFRAEAMAIAKLMHPNIVQVFTFGEDGGRHFFAMQFVDGESLADLLHRRGRLPLDEALPIFEQCLAGLAVAHRHDLIHRDIKPGNILLDRRNHRALVADFGLVKTFDGANDLTATGVIMGTVDYISPEQARSQKVDGRSDLYSLGALMYQTLSGRLPFVSDSATGLMFMHAYEQPRPLAEIAPELPKRISAIVVRLMAKDPAQRYATAEDVLADIEAFRAGKPPAIAAAGEPKSRIITPPALATPGRLPSTAMENPIGRWRDRLWNLWYTHAPQAAQEILNTQHQIDGAVVLHQRRRDELAELLRAAEGVKVECAAQAASHREAAIAAASRAESATDPDLAAQARDEQAKCERVAAEFENQLAEQQEQLDEIQLRLTQVEATLQKLRSQRDLLQARLRAAQARLALEGGTPAPRRSRLAKPMMITAAALGAMLLAVALLHKQNVPGAPSIATPPQLAVAPAAVPALPAISDKIILWNTHNNHWADRGTTACNVELRQGGQVVWSKKDVHVAWSNTDEPATEIPIPDIPFDTVHVDVTAWMGWGAGLCEIEVIKGGQNIALAKPVKASGERAPYSAVTVVDGIKTSAKEQTGYWWAIDHQPAWIEVELAPSKTAAQSVASPAPTAPAAPAPARAPHEKRTGEFRVFAPISKVSISNDGNAILVNREGESQLYETAGGRALGEVRPNSVATGFLPDGQTPFAAPWEGAFKLLDPQTGAQSGEGVSGWQVKSVSFSPDGLQSAVGELRGALTISDLTNRQQRRHAVYDRNHPIFANAFSPDGKRVLTVTSGGEAKWFDAVTGSQTGTVEGPLSTVLAVLPDGRIVSAAPRGLGSVEVRDASEGKVVARWLGHGTTINDIAVSRDGHCVSVAQDNSARLWNTSTGTSTVLWQNDAELVSVGFSTDGKNLVIAERSGLIRYWLGWSVSDVVENKPEIPTDRLFQVTQQAAALPPQGQADEAVSTATAPYLSEIPVLSAIRDESLAAPVSLAGELAPHGFMLRPVGVLGHMVFDIAGRQAIRFRGRVGLNDSMPGKSSTLPQTFRIVADDKPVWKSQPLQQRGSFQEFDIQIAGVKKIELVNESPDIDKDAHPVWAEPRIGTAVSEAIERLAGAKEFGDVEADETAFSQAAEGVAAAAQHRELTIGLRELSEQALAGGKYPEAKYLLRMAAIAAGKSNEPALVKEIDTRQAEAEATRAEFDATQKSRITLADDPADPAANLQLGSFECFYQGNWEAGLPRIARGGTGGLSVLARRELQANNLPSKLAEVANDWWNIADAETGVPAKQILFHSAALYRRAAVALGDGAAKAEATQRLREVAQMPDAPIEIRACSWCRILNRATGQYLAVSEGSRNRGHGVIQWPATGDADQQWQIEFNAQGCARITNRNSGLDMGIREGSKTPGMDAIQWNANGYPWRLQRVSGKYVRFVAVLSGLCLDVDNVRADQSIPGTSETQFWSLELVP